MSDIPESKKRPRESCTSSTNKRFCSQCDPRFCTYASHADYAVVSTPLPVAQLFTCPKILGSAEQFCEAFFHVMKSPEYGIPHHMSIFGTQEDKCRMQCVSLVAHLQSSDSFTHFLARYTNCRRKHTEQLMAEDASLLSLLSKLDTSRSYTFEIHLKFQPCHKSGGNATYYPEGYLFQGLTDQRSCTTILIDFYNQWLKPRGIGLTVYIASIYKANWEFATRPDDLQTVANALEGVKLLIRSGIELKAFSLPQWQFLSGLAHDVPLAHLGLEERVKTDVKNGLFLDKLKK